jgi:hypothetical protein
MMKYKCPEICCDDLIPIRGVALLIFFIGLCLLGRPSYIPYDFRATVLFLDITRNRLVISVFVMGTLLIVFLSQLFWCRHCRKEGSQLCHLCMGKITVRPKYRIYNFLSLAMYAGLVAECVNCGYSYRTKRRYSLRGKMHRAMNLLRKKFLAWAHQPPKIKRLVQREQINNFRHCR